MITLHISGARSWGGNEQQLVDIIPELEKTNCKNIVFGVSNTPLEKYCLAHQIPFIPCKGRKINAWKNYAYLKKVAQETRATAIHLHTSDSLTTYVLADLFYAINVKAFFSKKGISKSSTFLSRFKYNYKNIHQIVCVSEKTKNDFSATLSQKNQEKLIVLQDSVNMAIVENNEKVNDLRETYGISESTFIIGNIANHTPAKDLNTLIDVAIYLRDELKWTDFKMLQFGEYSKHTEALQEKIKANKLEDYIDLIGLTPKAYLYNPQFNCFLLTSEREGGPTSVLEAMAFATPIVTTAVGLMPSIIINGENGFISAVKDVPSLANNVYKIHEMETIPIKMKCDNAALIRTDFNSTMIAEKLKSIYNGEYL